MVGELGKLSWSAEAMLMMRSATGMMEDVRGVDTATRARWYRLNRLVLACSGGCRERSSHHLEFQLSRKQVLVNLP